VCERQNFAGNRHFTEFGQSLRDDALIDYAYAYRDNHKDNVQATRMCAPGHKLADLTREGLE